MSECDVIVVGGGPAGLMAAAAAGDAGARVVLLEKGRKLGRKLIISGGGRCNVTNRRPFDALLEHIPGNGRFLYSAFHEFGSEEIIRFFEGLGIRLKEEDHGRMFPVSDRAIDVADALIGHLRRLGVQLRVEAPVDRLLITGDRCAGVVLRTGEALSARSVVVAVGGCSVPATGSTGDGYAWARQAGHTITPLYPTEVPITADEPWIRDRSLQGLSLRAVVLTLWDDKGKRLTTQRGDMIFTHFGLSGPAVLRISHYVSVARLKRGSAPLTVTIDLLPQLTPDAVADRLAEMVRTDPRKLVRTALRGLLPDRLIPVALSMAGVSETLTCAHATREQWLAIGRLCKAFPVRVAGTLPLADAFVTGGGVSIREVDPRSMQSRLKPGLFFAGEVLDVHGHTGGYNITVAFSTGHMAGRSAAELACIASAPTT